MQEQGLGMMGGGSGGGGGGISGLMGGDIAFSDHYRQLKAEIATHPLYEQLLSAHVSCLRVATPIDQLPLIDAQLNQSQSLLRSYVTQHNYSHSLSPHERQEHNHSHSLSSHQRQELDNFLVRFLLHEIYILSPF